MERLATPLVLLVACGILAGAAWGYKGAVNTTNSVARLSTDLRPYTPITVRPTEAPERVVVVVLDGLRLDESRALPTVNMLRAKGVDGQAEVPLPTLSRPSWTAMVSGAEPWRSGVRNNQFPGQVPPDTIFARAHDGGVATAGAANWAWMSQNFPAAAWELAPDGAVGKPLNEAVDRALEKRAPLTLLHFVQIDAVAHEKGVGAEYRDTALNADASLKHVVDQLDLSREAVIVLSDHGHRDVGGHGGDEPEVVAVPVVMAGRGVRHATAPLQLGSTAGLAATLGVLLGLELPRDHHVAPWTSALDVDVLGAEYLASRDRDSAQHRAEYNRRWLRGVFENWTSKDWNDETVGNDVSDQALVAEGAPPEELIAARQRVFDEISRDHRLTRTVGMAFIVVILSVLSIVGLVRGYGGIALVVGPATAVAITVGHVAAGLPLTRSLAVTSDRFFAICAIEAGLGFAVAFGLIALIVRWRVPAVERAGARKYHLFVTSTFLLISAPTLWLINGFAIDAPLPGPVLMFLPNWTAVVSGAIAVVAAVAIALHPPSRREPAVRRKPPTNDA